MTKNITSTTEKGREGINISWSEEQDVGRRLLKVLPRGWKVDFHWMQILFSDVQYEIDRKKKTVKILYNKGLSYWSGNMIKEIQSKINKGKEEGSGKERRASSKTAEDWDAGCDNLENNWRALD